MPLGAPRDVRIFAVSGNVVQAEADTSQCRGAESYNVQISVNSTEWQPRQAVQSLPATITVGHGSVKVRLAAVMKM